MKKRYYAVLIAVILSVGIVVGLHVTGYLWNDQRMIPPSASVETKTLAALISESQINESRLPFILNLSNILKGIPGIESVKYEVFVSNDSLQQNLEYYRGVLEKDGYSYHQDYSGTKTHGSYTVSYAAFSKGLNGVVIFVSEYHNQTWVCYTTSDVFHYQQIYNYLVDHHIL